MPLVIRERGNLFRNGRTDEYSSRNGHELKQPVDEISSSFAILLLNCIQSSKLTKSFAFVLRGHCNGQHIQQ